VKFPKSKRFVSKENLQWARDRPCDVCGDPSPSDPAHIKTRKSGGHDHKSNLMSLCRSCHTIQGMMGIKSFIKEHHLPISYEDGIPRRTDLKDND